MSKQNDSKQDIESKESNYAVEVKFEGHGGEVRSFKALDLSLQGLIVDTQDDLVTTNDHFLISFDLPNTKYRVQEYVVVTKTYDEEFSGPKKEAKETFRHLAEVEFTEGDIQSKNG